MRKNITISLLLGGVLSVLALYFAFKNVPFYSIYRYLRSIDYIWIIPSIMLGLLGFVLRVIRWQVLLLSVRPLGFWQSFHPLMVGFMVNCILPGRVGEAVRPLILQKKEKISFITGLATVATERVFDITILIVFFALLLLNLEINPDYSIRYGDYQLNRRMLEIISGGMLKLCFLLIVGIVLISVKQSRRLIVDFIMKLPGLFSWAGKTFKDKMAEKICLPITRGIEHIAIGFQMVKKPRRMLFCLVLTIAVWLLTAASYYVMAFGCPGVNLSFLEFAAVMIIICFFIALPSVPGFWGVWEAGGVFALTLFGVSAADSAGFTLANHAAQIIPVILVGFGSAVYTGIDIWRISHELKTHAD